MAGRRIISYALFVLGVLIFLLLGLLGQQLGFGILLGLIFVLVGIIFYRRGK